MSSLNDCIRPVDVRHLYQMDVSDNTVVIITGVNQVDTETISGVDVDELCHYLHDQGAEYVMFDFGIDHGQQVNSIFHRAFECVLDAYTDGEDVIITGPETATNNTLAFTARAELKGQKFWHAFCETDLTIPPLQRMYAKNILWNINVERNERLANEQSA